MVNVATIVQAIYVHIANGDKQRNNNNRRTKKKQKRKEKRKKNL